MSPVLIPAGQHSPEAIKYLAGKHCDSRLYQYTILNTHKPVNQFLSILTLLFCGTALAAESSRDYPITPVPFTAVHLADSFWAPRIETNRLYTIPFAFQQCEKS